MNPQGFLTNLQHGIVMKSAHFENLTTIIARAQPYLFSLAEARKSAQKGSAARRDSGMPLCTAALQLITSSCGHPALFPCTADHEKLDFAKTSVIKDFEWKSPKSHELAPNEDVLLK